MPLLVPNVIAYGKMWVDPADYERLERVSGARGLTMSSEKKLAKKQD
jgi:hypothetical protein